VHLIVGYFPIALCKSAARHALIAAAACVLGSPSVAQHAPPRLTGIVPASGPAGTAYPIEATLRGTGFKSSGNVVQFGPVRIPGVKAADAGRIVFSIPKSIPSRGEVAPFVVPPGEYQVTVATDEGISNSVTFTLTKGP
jgi:hypothetical protein